MNDAACNYDPSAQYAGSCTFPEPGFNCTGDCASDVDEDGVCDGDEVPGCTNAEALNFDPLASDDDGSCELPSEGCMNLTACNYSPSANEDDGSCEFESCAGCLAPAACNYVAGAIYSAECIWPTPGYDCSGECLNDADGDEVCDADEVSGCTDSDAINYNENATEDNGTCVLSIDGCTDPSACNYDGEANNDDDSCEFESCAGCISSSACNYDETAIYAGDCVWPEEGYNCEGECISGNCAGCTISFACNYNSEATIDDGSCEFTSCLEFGCTDTLACNYNANADFDDGSCTYANAPYDCNGDCVNDADEDGICDEFEINGCTDITACNYSDLATSNDGSCTYDCTGCTIPSACNYDDTATQDDGSCEFTSCIVVGCTNPLACNYNVEAMFDDGSCYFAEDGYDCEGNCLDDLDGDGICDADEVAGCTDVCACNFATDATDDDSSCVYEGCSGCTYSTALNFDPNASMEDGSCLFEGCMDDEFSNYNPFANESGEAICTDLPVNADFNDDGSVQLQDLLEFLIVYGTSAPDYGGTIWAQEACDVTPYDDSILLEGTGFAQDDPEAVCYPNEGCTYPFALNFDSEATSDAGFCVFPGCTDSEAVNYNSISNVDDGTCKYTPCPDLNGDGLVQLHDLLDFLMAWGVVYE